MYQIKGGRNLFILEQGQWKRIKKTDILFEQQMEVYIKAIHPRRGELSDAFISDDYIKKKIEFNHGAGIYRIKDSYLSIELVYRFLGIVYCALFLINLILYAIDKYTSIYISSEITTIPFIFLILFIFPIIICSIAMLGMWKIYLEDLSKLKIKLEKCGGVDKIR